MNFYLNWHRNSERSKFCFWMLKLLPFTIPVPVEVEVHTVPYFKALVNTKVGPGGLKWGGTFTSYYSIVSWINKTGFVKTGVHYRQKENTTFALYEVKLVLFKWVFGYVKVLPHSYQPGMFWPLMRPFEWGTAWSSTLRGIRITTSQSQKYQKMPTLLSKLR